MICIIIINVLCGIYGGLDSRGEIPAWVCILTGLLYVCYHLFDLSDGKHARNTKNSSPLGLLVDHGVDALTSFLFLMSLANIIKLGKNFNLKLFIELLCFFYILKCKYSTSYEFFFWKFNHVLLILNI